MLYYVADYFALVLLWIVWPRGSDKFETSNKSSWYFMIAIILNMVFSFSNICNGIVDNVFPQAGLVPRYAINTIYYITACLMVYFYAKYILQKVEAYANNKKHIATFYGLIDGFTVILIGICLLNLEFPVIFYFNEQLELMHGFFWIICYVEVGVMAVLLYTSVYVCRSRTTTQLKNVIIAILPMVAFIVAFRVIFPQILFEGMAGAATALILMLKFQTYSQEMDFQTRLGNLQAFVTAIDKHGRNKDSIQLIMLSIRNLSDINSNYGYEMGDRILFKIAYWLEDYFPNNVEIYRYGASTFVAIFDGKNSENGEKRVHDMMAHFPKLWGDGSRRIYLSSFCVDLSCSGSYNSTRVIEELDYARKKVKYSEVDHMHFDELVYGKLQQRKAMIKYLDKAIEQKLFEVFFQPIRCTADGCFCSSEALLRLKNNEGRYMNTEELVSIAEETGQINAINDIIIDKVCRFLGEHRDNQVKNISVNMTLSQLQNPDFPLYVASKCQEYGADAGRIGFEITERMIISEDAIVQNTLSELRKQGHMFLLDDFGTGYSNFLGVLKHPLDKVKIDKSLLRDDTENNRAAIRMLIELFHKNNQSVVVEGVETESQRDFLIECNADFLQGYHYSRPLPEEQYIEFLKVNR